MKFIRVLMTGMKREIRFASEIAERRNKREKRSFLLERRVGHGKKIWTKSQIDSS